MPYVLGLMQRFGEDGVARSLETMSVGLVLVAQEAHQAKHLVSLANWAESNPDWFVRGNNWFGSHVSYLVVS